MWIEISLSQEFMERSMWSSREIDYVILVGRMTIEMVIFEDNVMI